MRILARFPKELLGATVLGTLVAVVWAVLGTAWTWAVDPVIRFTPLSTRATLTIIIPAFTMGWLFFLARRVAFKSMKNWVGTAFLCACAGSILHRAVFFADGFWDEPARSLSGEIDLVLAALVSHTVTHDVGFLGLGDMSAGMTLGTLAAAAALAAAVYSPLRRAVT